MYIHMEYDIQAIHMHTYTNISHGRKLIFRHFQFQDDVHVEKQVTLQSTLIQIYTCNLYLFYTLFQSVFYIWSLLLLSEVAVVFFE